MNMNYPLEFPSQLEHAVVSFSIGYLLFKIPFMHLLIFEDVSFMDSQSGMSENSLFFAKS